MNYVNNVFTLGMLENPEDASGVIIKHMSKADAQRWLGDNQWVSVVGHGVTSDIVSQELGYTIYHNRATVKLNVGDQLLVTQYMGARLEEGCTTLPEGATFDYFLVEVVDFRYVGYIDGGEVVCFGRDDKWDFYSYAFDHRVLVPRSLYKTARDCAHDMVLKLSQ